MRNLLIVVMVFLAGCAGTTDPEPEDDVVVPVVAAQAAPEGTRLSLRCNKDGEELSDYGRPKDTDRDCKDTNPGTYTLR